jgi:RNA recognition motif-containing protein
VRWQNLKDLFRKAGTVLRANVSLGPDNRSRGYGNVLLATTEEAGRAIDMFNGYSWQTRTLEVRPDRLPPDLETPTAGATRVDPLAAQSFISEELDYAATFGAQDTSSKNLFVGNVKPFSCGLTAVH